MRRSKIIGIVLMLTLVAAACSSGDDEEPAATGATGGDTGATGSTGALSQYGESTDADPALIAKALGPVEPSDEASWNIILASVARANQDLDQATIDKAMECWSKRRSVTPAPAATS